jgi:hypothetical protein
MSVPFDEIRPFAVRREVKRRGSKTLCEIEEFLAISCQYLDVGIIGFLDFANNNLFQFTATGFEIKVGLWSPLELSNRRIVCSSYLLCEGSSPLPIAASVASQRRV